MTWLLIAAGLAAAIIALSYICYLMAYSVPGKGRRALTDLPDSAQYVPYLAETRRMIDAALSIPYEDVWTQSADGLALHGKLYAAAPDAPVQIMFHGYRSAAERDFCGGLQLAISGGFNAILVDERAHGQSEGKCLSFGVLERHDCLAWINYARGRFGDGAKILLYGMSMGASTVLMAAGLPLPENVVGIAADCGYTSPRAIMQAVLKKRGYPVFPVYQLTRLGGRIFGGFDIEEASAPEALSRCKTPVLLIHGDEDHFVPCEMGRENFASCAADKRLLIVPGAGHGLSYMLDREAYISALSEFLERVLK